jgi:hypothetical protein
MDSKPWIEALGENSGNSDYINSSVTYSSYIQHFLGLAWGNHRAIAATSGLGQSPHLPFQAQIPGFCPYPPAIPVFPRKKAGINPWDPRLLLDRSQLPHNPDPRNWASGYPDVSARAQIPSIGSGLAPEDPTTLCGSRGIKEGGFGEILAGSSGFMG